MTNKTVEKIKELINSLKYSEYIEKEGTLWERGYRLGLHNGERATANHIEVLMLNDSHDNKVVVPERFRELLLPYTKIEIFKPLFSDNSSIDLGRKYLLSILISYLILSLSNTTPKQTYINLFLFISWVLNEGKEDWKEIL